MRHLLSPLALCSACWFLACSSSPAQNGDPTQSPPGSGGDNGGPAGGGASSGGDNNASGGNTNSGGNSSGDGDVGDGDGRIDDNNYSDPQLDTVLRPEPHFGPLVSVFKPDTDIQAVQARMNEVFELQETAQMEARRFAFLLHPGAYNLDINVGYYTDVVGLGSSPDDVVVTGAVRAEADWFQGNATHNFWRSAANMKVVPTYDNGFNRWAVSQAAPFRRMHIAGDLALSDGGWSSGGFLADSLVDGQVDPGSQQQWFTRNSQIGGWGNGGWNMFFLGVTNAPNREWSPYTILPSAPLLREKPFLFVNGVGNYYVHVPDVREDAAGVSWSTGSTPGRSIAIEEFYIAFPDVDDATSINAALSSGKNLLLTPGVYHLTGSIQVSRRGTVVLGLGLPTLVAESGNLVLEVADVDGVKVAGITIDAGPQDSPTLMRMGPLGSSLDHATNPSSIHDIFCRIGGGFPGRASGCLEINSNQVLGDHFWLWRADHGNGVGWDQNRSKNGLVVNGRDVTIYGLFVEHFHEFQTLWNGENGRVYFYQCEMPYDPPNQAAWQHDGVNGFAGYKVTDAVTTHEAWGLGVYGVFQSAPVKSENAFEVPQVPGVKMHHMVTKQLGAQSGEITHVINGQGDNAVDANGATYAEYPPAP